MSNIKSTRVLPPGEWIGSREISQALGLTYSQLRARSAELGIVPTHLGSLRFYSPDQVRRLQPDRESPIEVRPGPMPGQAEKVAYPDGWIAPARAARLLGVPIAHLKPRARELEVRFIRLPGTHVSHLAYSDDDIRRALKTLDLRAKKRAAQPAGPGFSAAGIPVSRIRHKPGEVS